MTRIRTFSAALAVLVLATAPGMAAPAAPPPAPAGWEWAGGLLRDLGPRGGWAATEDLGRPATRDDLARALAVLTGRPAGTGDARPVTATQAGSAVLGAMGLSREMAGLRRLGTADGRRFTLPPGFAAAVLTRELGLRRNHPAPHEGLERADREPMALGDLLLMVERARTTPSWRVRSVARFRDITLPAMGPAQRTVVQAAIGQVGMPYVWAGDWPSAASPWGPQATGGYDCSGLVWMAFKGAAPSVRIAAGRDLLGRTADALAWEAPRQRIRLTDLAPGDLVFFGDRGERTARGAVGHVGIALGGGWMIHSSGSRAGVSVSHLDDYWRSGLAGARRPGVFGTAGSPGGSTPPPATTPAPPAVPRPAPLAPVVPAAPVVAPPGAGPAPLVGAPVANPPARRA